jgi:hypothetical protein
LDPLTNDFDDLIDENSNNEAQFTNYLNQYMYQLPMTKNFTDLLNLSLNSTNEYSNTNINIICGDSAVCTQFINVNNDSGNKINSKGIYLAIQSVMQILNNIFKDYTSIYKSKNDYNKNDILYYFNNTDFSNLNQEIEFVFNSVNNLLFENVKEDMNLIYSYIANINLILGILVILSVIAIAFYLVFGLFARLRKYLFFISYTAAKFNRALFTE